MNCPKCGFEIAQGHRFCMNCGTSVARELEEEARETQEAEDAPEAAETEANPAEESTEAEHPARRRRIAPAPPEEAPAPAAEEAPEAAPVRAPAPVQAPKVRYPQPPRQKAVRSVASPMAAEKKYKRSSGTSVWLWVGILVLVLGAAYAGACILMPENPLTAPAVNLALTVWNYFSVCGKYLLWFPIALGAIILLAVLKMVAGRPLRRKIHAGDLAEARELASRVVVAETLAPPHQIHAEIAELLDTRKTRKQYFPKGRYDFGEFSGSGVPLDYSCGKDRFTANFVFQRMDRAGTRVFLEIIEWQLNNGCVSKRCLSAMRGLEPMLRDTVLDIDTSAAFQVYDR